jgi:hypothetical protein
MNIDKKYFLVVLASVVLSISAVYIGYISKALSWQFLFAFMAVQVICFVYSVLGFVYINIAFKIFDNSFISVVMGGIFIRLLLILMLVIISLKVLNVKEDIFIFSLFVFYNYYLILEIYYLIKKDGLRLKKVC